MFALLLIAAVSQVEYQPTGIYAPAYQPTGVNVQSAGYPARGGTRYWVYVNGVRYHASVEHLSQGEHAGDFDVAWLRTLSQEDLDWLHSHAHSGTVQEKYVRRPTKPAAVQSTGWHWEYRKVCIRPGVCELRLVKVQDK